MSDQIRPGIMRCAKCKLIVIQSVMNAHTGAMTANTEPARCPNNCGPMWHVTWKESAQIAEADAVKAFDRIATLECELAEAKAREERLRAAIAPMVSALRKHRFCGDQYPEEGWLEVNVALANYAALRQSV